MSTYIFEGRSYVFEDELDGGEYAVERAMSAAFTRADEAMTGKGYWQMVDATVKSVLHSNLRTYHASITVEVIND